MNLLDSQLNAGGDKVGYVSDLAAACNAPFVLNVEDIIRETSERGETENSSELHVSRTPIDIVCSELRTVFVVDVDAEMRSNYDSCSRLDMVKRCIKAHVQAVLSSPSVNVDLFAICILHSDGQAAWYLNYTCDLRRIFDAVERIELDNVGACPCDLSAVIEKLQSNAPGGFEKEDFLYHIVLVHSRSGLCPVFSKTKQSHMEFLSHRQVVFDIVFLHNRVTSEEKFGLLREIHAKLCEVIDVGSNVDGQTGEGKWPSYVFSGFENEEQMCVNFLMLAAHPALRENQTADPLQFHKKIFI
eukprot:g1563.t1